MKEVDMYESQDSVDCIDNSFELQFGGLVNGSPMENWTDRYTPKFQSGDIIINNIGSIYKVIGYDKDPNTFLAKASGNNTERSIDGIDYKKAPPNTIWESYNDQNNPFKVKGLKITIPSNMS